MKKAVFPAVCAALMLVGCSTVEDDRFPSLAKRPYEDGDVIDAPQNTEAPPPASLPQPLAQRVSALEAQAMAAERAFRGQLGQTRSMAADASGSARSSDRWVSAHIALSALDRSRAGAVAALAEIDALLREQLDAALAGGVPDYAPLMEPAQERIAAIVNGQTSEIETLGRMIGY